MANTIKITNGGFNLIAAAVKNASPSPIYLGWGTGTTLPLATDTVLEIPRTEDRVAGVSSLITTYATNDTFRVVGIIVCRTTPAVISEVALFDSNIDGVLFSRTVLETPISLAVGDSIEFEYDTVFK